MDCSPPGSSVHGISQARMLGWVAFSPGEGDLPNPEIKPASPALQVGSLPLSHLGNSKSLDSASWKFFEKEIPESFMAFILYFSYLHCIYTILGITSNLEILLEDVCKYYTILYKALEHPQILVSEGTPGTSRSLILRGDCTSFSYAPEKLIRPRRGTSISSVLQITWGWADRKCGSEWNNF